MSVCTGGEEEVVILRLIWGISTEINATQKAVFKKYRTNKPVRIIKN